MTPAPSPPTPTPRLPPACQVNPDKRLGSDKRLGADEIKKHRWFSRIDWKAMEQRKLPAPFKPRWGPRGVGVGATVRRLQACPMLAVCCEWWAHLLAWHAHLWRRLSCAVPTPQLPGVAPFLRACMAHA